MTKRLLDVVVSGIGLAILAPFMAIVALAVLVDTGRPVFFSQERVGRHGKGIRVYKFRTMTTGTVGDRLITVSGDRRVTRVGARLRSTKVDELPQLWNVLRGDLSLVGPRPEVPQYVALWPKEDRALILSVRPGITDPASRKYRREEELLAAQRNPEDYYRTVVLPDKVLLYRDYVKHRSNVGDARLLIATLSSIVGE